MQDPRRAFRCLSCGHKKRRGLFQEIKFKTFGRVLFFSLKHFFHPVMAANVYHRTYQSGAQVLPELNEIVLIPHSLC